MSKYRPLLLAIVISFVYFLIHLFIINDYGLSWDYHFHLYGGLHHLGLPVPKATDPPPVPFTPPDPRLTVEDPFGPIMSIVPVISQKLFFEKLNLLPFDSAYNLPSVIYGALGIGLIFLFLFQAVGLPVAVIGSLFLALLPNYFGYLHNNMKDIPSAFAFALSIYTFWRLVKKRRIRDLVFAVISFAFAFNIKINSIFIPVICGAWYGVIRGIGKIREREWKMVVSYFILAPLAALALWWPFWKDPLGKLMELPKFYSLNTINIPVLLFGNIFRSGINIPWFYPFVYIGITTPLSILIAFLIGIFISVKAVLNPKSETRNPKQIQMAEIQKSKHFWLFKYLNLDIVSNFVLRASNFRAKRGFYLLALIWFFVPLLRYLSPKTGAIDGVRHFMEVVYPLCAIAGIGAVNIYEKLIKIKGGRFVAPLLSLIIVISLIRNIVHFHPYQTSFYNSLIGGIKGAYGKFDIDFWGTPQKDAMLWLNKNAPDNSIIYIVMAQSSAAVYLRDDLRRNANSKNMLESDYVVINNKQSFFTDQIASFIKQKTTEGKLVYLREIDEVPLVWVFKS